MQKYRHEDIDAAYSIAIEKRVPYPAGYALGILKKKGAEQQADRVAEEAVDRQQRQRDARLLDIIKGDHVDWGPTWDECREALRKQVPHTSFEAWIEGIKGMAVEDSLVVLGVPSASHAEHLRGRFHGL